ncbi:MAG: ribonuclease III [bacterium]|nr:MAG: ribonuclease III [bacterium]
MERIIGILTKKYNISFNNPALLITAFKHRSYLNVTNEERIASNERLEFLGDAVLDLVVTDYLYRKFPKRTEGQLSKIKSILVSKPVLAETAAELSFGNLILINKGEEKTGGRQRQSILSDTFEALIGAIYLDKGLETASAFINTYLLSRFKSIMQRELYTNYKSILLEHAQSHFGTLPDYRVMEEMGPDHEKEFIIGVYLDGKEIGRGQGKSKKTAEQDAAKMAIQKLELPNNEHEE